MRSGESKKPIQSVRCAIYTRKSSEEGLEQDFNSLDAQREACTAYVRSQVHTGWTLIDTLYDDGGFSGGTLKRPALQRLISDISRQKIDIIVVYKVDRLTRALADFAKLVEIFDAQGVSFVSVTQQFNTTTSMGRLTLNVLLSFAQFEREVTGERIRDKIAASKKKGLWMGGLVPLGYDAKDRRLEVNESEAATVRYIFQRYVELGSVSELKAVLDTKGVVSKHRVSANGRRSGGTPLSRGMLYGLLHHRLYRGEIAYRGKTYPGQHAAIVDQALWEQAQTLLAANRTEHKVGSRAKRPSLLAGLLYDDRGERMTPSHAVKRGKRYRYYVSQSLIKQPKRLADGGRRLPAGDIEQLVSERIRKLLGDGAQLSDVIQPRGYDVPTQKRVLDNAAQLVNGWQDRSHGERRAMLLDLIDRVDVHRERVDLHLRPARLVGRLLGEAAELRSDGKDAQEQDHLKLEIFARYKRAGLEMKLIVDGPGGHLHHGQADPSLVKLIVKAHQLKELFIHSNGHSFKQLAKQQGINASYFTRLLRLTFLAPDITHALLEGRHPVELTAARLMRNTRFPLDWQKQRRLLGFS